MYATHDIPTTPRIQAMAALRCIATESMPRVIRLSPAQERTLDAARVSLQKFARMLEDGSGDEQRNDWIETPLDVLSLSEPAPSDDPDFDSSEYDDAVAWDRFDAMHEAYGDGPLSDADILIVQGVVG